MNDYVILTDAAADHIEEIMKYFPFVDVIPMPVRIGNEDRIYGGPHSTISCERFYALQRNGIYGSTSSISPGVYYDYFNKYLSQGLDVVYLCLSSGMSSTYSAACIVAEELKSEYPQRSIFCIDALNGSTPQGFLVREAAKKKNEGLSLQELADWINDHKQKVGVYFSVDTLDHLVHGGRLSKTSAVIGSTLRIKPFLTINREGKIEVIARPVGMHKSMHMMTEKMKEEWDSSTSKYVLICHGDSKERGNELKDMIEKRFPDADVETDLVDPIIGTHTGPGMISLCFWSSERK